MKTSSTSPITSSVRDRLAPWKMLAITFAGAACLSISATAAPIAQPNPSPGHGGGNEKEGVFNEFAGGYQGNCVLSSNGITAFGRADAFIRGGKSGGGLTLRSTISASGQTIKVKRILTFKRRSFKSKSVLIAAGNVQPGSGGGRFTAKENFLRYNENATFTSSGVPQAITISGDARFFRNSILVTEIWSVSGQSLAFKHRLRPR